MDNPYRDALKGLDLSDPVQAFFDFCREREAIRIKRERGDPPPWSADPIFQRGRFLNVFREDDRGTKAVLRFARQATADLPSRIHALFFARWCNRAETLNRLAPDLLANPDRLRAILLHEVEIPWCSDAYPVEPIQWEGRAWDRLEAAIEVLPRGVPFLTDSVRGARGRVVAAVQAINSRFHMANDFPIFMAVIDLAWLEPEWIHPDSAVPTGIGAEPYMNLLQQHLGQPDHEATARQMIARQPAYWPEAKRPLQPIDVEYLCCECRKYHSYVNGTKRFEGRNLFVPAKIS